MLNDDSEPSPPARKRQRMSSPTYDEQVDISQDDIEAFDRIEHTLSQSQTAHVDSPRRKVPFMQTPHKKRDSPTKMLSAREKRQRAIEEALRDYPGKENVHGRRDAPKSPMKEPESSSQPQFELDHDNPFNVSSTYPYLLYDMR